MLLETAPRCELEAALGTVETVLCCKVSSEVGQRADGQAALRAHLQFVGVLFFAAAADPISPAPFLDRVHAPRWSVLQAWLWDEIFYHL